MNSKPNWKPWWFLEVKPGNPPLIKITLIRPDVWEPKTLKQLRMAFLYELPGRYSFRDWFNFPRQLTSHKSSGARGACWEGCWSVSALHVIIALLPASCIRRPVWHPRQPRETALGCVFKAPTLLLNSPPSIFVCANRASHVHRLMLNTITVPGAFRVFRNISLIFRAPL